jgi:hypothetical protein
MTWTSPLALWPFRRSPAPTTCAEAGRTGALVKAERERDRIRAKAIAMADSMGRPEMADPLRKCSRIIDPLERGALQSPRVHPAREGSGSPAPLSHITTKGA